MKKASAFSLIEVTLALGIVSFALIAVLGLIPVGLVAFRKAVDVSVSSQIVQQVVSDAQQTDFNSLAKTGSLRYFDDQGVELASSASSVYQVNVVVNTAAGVPGDSSPASLAQLTIEIVKNPGNRALTRAADGSIQEDPSQSIAVTRFPAFVAKSQ